MSAKCRIPVNKTSGEMGIKGKHRGGQSKQTHVFFGLNLPSPKYNAAVGKTALLWGHWKIRLWFCIWP